MANPQVWIQLSANFFKRNNPIQGAMMAMLQGVYTLATFQSRRKLLTYNFYLAQQKLGRMEEVLNDCNPYGSQGVKINKIY